MQVSAAEQNDSVAKSELDDVEISLLTCQPHDQVYSLYGHTALRICNNRTGEDVAVNYGVFDTSKDFFVMRFLFGLTDYMMATYDFADFLAEYRYYGSGVYQQRLNLTTEQKARMLSILAENAKPENVVYRYNFYYNNCTTRIRDIIFEATPDATVFFERTQSATETFRDLIHEKNEEHRWARFGNDMILGMGSDVVATPHECEFIPDRLMKHLDQWEISNGDSEGTRRPLVDTAYWVLQPGVPYKATDNDFPMTPTQCAILLLCVIMSLIIVERLIAKKELPWMYSPFMFACGCVGVILFLMLFSKHPTVNINLQILIFNPLMFTLISPKACRKYGWHVVLALCLLLFAGNLLQDYAEGVNIVACALSMVSVNRIVGFRKKQADKFV